MFLRVTAVLCLLAPALSAWNVTTHRAISFLAYGRLNERARARVGEILRVHPDYASMFATNAPGDPKDATRAAFAAAAAWPDLIRNDPRFGDKPGSTPSLPGFPDMLRHQEWHYINMPVPSTFRDQQVEPVNVLSEIRRLLKVLRKSGPVSRDEAYALPWILHLIGDVHQPLHSVSRFTGPGQQDKGGNACYLAEDRNLHSLWDNLVGPNGDEAAMARMAAVIENHLAEPRKLELKPEKWVQEGVELSTSFVYSFPGGCANPDKPLALPAGYKAKARQLAMQRGALAAYRLAEVLNERLGA
jgi:hypothetical protein